MKFRILLLLAALLGATPAVAQVPSNYNLTDSGGHPFLIATFNCRASQTLCLLSVPSDYNGNAMMGAVGTTNPNNTAEYIQGVTGGVPVPVSMTSLPAFAAPPSINLNLLNGSAPSTTNPLFIAPASGASFNVVCTSGCAGGGGGGNVNITQILGAAPSLTNPLWITPASGASFPVTGTFWQTTQPVSITGTLPAFAATPTFNCGSGCSGSNTSVGLTASTVPTSATYLGASVAGTLTGLVATANGLKVDGSAATQPVSGTFWPYTIGQQLAAGSVPVVLTAAQVTALTPPAALTNFALETGGNLASIFGSIGAISGSPTANTVQARLAAINTTLNAPFQAGGSIANTSFGISGTLPAFAATPSVIISGTLPGFAATPTVNLGTIGGAATQTTLASVLTALASPFQAGGSIGNTSFATTQATASALNATVVGTGTFAVQASPATPASWGIGATAAATPANAHLVGMAQGGNLIAMTGTSGNLNVQCANCSGSGVSAIDTATYTYASSLFAAGGGFFQTTATTNPLTNGQQGMFQMTATRALFTNLRNASGVEIGTAASPIQVSLANTATNATPVTISGAITGTVTANAGTNLNTSLLALETGGNLAATATDLGTLGSTACATDNGSCNLNALIQRNNQRLSTIITTLNAPFQVGSSIGNTSFGATQATASLLNATIAGTGTIGGTLPTSAVLTGMKDGITGLVSPVIGDAATGQWVNITSIGGVLATLLIVTPSTAPVTATNPAMVTVTRPDQLTAASTATATTQMSLPTNESPNSQLSVTTGTTADAACSTDNGTCTLPALIKRNNQNLTTLNTTAGGAVAAGTATIGNFGYDPSQGKSTPTQAFLALPATTTTQIIALSASKVTYVTLAKVFAGGTVNFTFKYGTGTNCGTGTNTLEGPYPLTAQNGWVEGNGAGPVLIVPSGQALCITTDASVGGGVKLIYQQI